MDNLKRYFQQRVSGMDVDSPDPATWDRIAARTTAAGGVAAGDVAAGDTTARDAAATKMAAPRRIGVISRVAIAACVILLAGIGGWLLLRKPVASKPPITQSPAPAATPQPNAVATARPATRQTPQPPTPGLVQLPQNVQPPQNEQLPAIAKLPLEKTSSPRIDEHYAEVVGALMTRLRSTPVYAESPQYFAVFTSELKQIEKDERRIEKDIQTYGPGDDLLEQWINVYQQKIILLKHWQQEIDKMNNKLKGERSNAWHVSI